MQILLVFFLAILGGCYGSWSECVEESQMCMSELPDWTEEGAVKRANCRELRSAIECMEEALTYGSCGEYGGGGLNDFLGEMKEERNVKCNVSGGCDENEEFQTCGTACPLTCINYLNPPEFCTAQCVIGCACKKGFVETWDGKCVRPEQCDYHFRKCVENEEFQTCATDCPLTCDNYQNPPEICNYLCVTGCACKKGFVKTSDGRCVRPEQCQALDPVPDDNETKNCVDENTDYISECLQEGAMRVVEMLADPPQNKNLEDLSTCGLYIETVFCTVERINERCGEEAVKAFVRDISNTPEAVKNACRAVGVEIDSYLPEDKRKK